jgi:hypothetical protein
MSRFAVIFGFCPLLAGTQEIITSQGEHRGPNLIFMFSKHSSPLPASRFSITPLNSGSKWGKNDKIPKIRYKSVITQKSVVEISYKILLISPLCVAVSLPPSGLRVHASFMFYMLYNSLNSRF